MNANHIFVDTNILVYAHDADAGSKHDRAAKQILKLWDHPYPPAISTQVLHELYVTLLRKKAASADIRRVLTTYYDWEIVGHDLHLVNSGIDICERFKVSFWDAMIIAAAWRAHAAVLWSEDLQAGQKFDDVIVENPLTQSL